MLLKTRSRPLERRARRLECRGHLADVAASGCAVPGCTARDIEVHHRRGPGSTAAAGRRSGDDETVGLCVAHHRGDEGVHALGEPQFEARYGVNLGAHAASLWAARGGMP